MIKYLCRTIQMIHNICVGRIVNLFYWILFQREIVSRYEIRVSKMTNLTINTICILRQQKVFQRQQNIA